MLRAAGHHQRDQRRKRQSQGYDLLFHGVLPGWGWEASSPGDAFFGAPQMVCGAADLCDSGQVPDSEDRAAERVWRALPAGTRQALERDLPPTDLQTLLITVVRA